MSVLLLKSHEQLSIEFGSIPMCGFIGFLSSGQCSRKEATPEILQRMAHAIERRGPDSAGFWCHEAGIALGHRRLSILDLSPAGAQPMHSACSRYVIAFNGEIYNHLDLRAELDRLGSFSNGTKGTAWRGHSDTETLLAGFSAWGLPKTIERCVGMFAFAVWDKQTCTLTLGRDRLGEKPLYFGWQGSGQDECFLFGSELAALKAHPSFVSNIDRNALALYMRHSAIAAPHSIFKGINKLRPGYLLSVSLAQREPVLTQYWSLPQVAELGVATPFAGSDADAVDALEELLKDAVAKQMLADVPLGAFLSGGIDSSTVVALMQAQSSRRVKTFTIGFNEEGYNEAIHAKAVAKHLGTDHTELYVTPQQAIDVIPRLPSLFSEPFSDSSQIPTFLVSQLARSQVTVSLSGDAGDELFCGYSRYPTVNKAWHQMNSLPFMLRVLGVAGIRALSPASWNAVLAHVRSMLPLTLRSANLGDKLHKAAALLNARSLDELYCKTITNWEPDDVLINANEPSTHLRGQPLSLNGLCAVERMMALDAITYLPDDILTKVDRAAMGVSLEARVPFLDHRVVEFAWRLPQHMKSRNGLSKWALRQVLYRHVPRDLIERPKMGFAVPIGDWLRGPLRDWAEDLLDEDRLRQEGFFNKAIIRQKWAEHLSGQRNWQSQLWNVLMFQSWLASQKQ